MNCIPIFSTFTYPSTSRPLAGNRTLTGNGGLRWTPPRDRALMERSLTVAGKAERQRRGETPGHELLNLPAGRDMNDHSTVVAGVETIPDQSCRVHGSGSRAAGIGITRGVKLTF